MSNSSNSNFNRSYRRAIQRITIIEKLGTAIRVGWGWIIFPIFLLIVCWLYGIHDLTPFVSGIDPLLRKMRSWWK